MGLHGNLLLKKVWPLSPSSLIASLSLDPWPLQRITILPQHLKELQNKAVVGHIK